MTLTIELAKLFSKLAASGKIVPDEVTSVIPFNLTQPDYWEDLASKLFRGDIAPDYSFPSRASKFV